MFSSGLDVSQKLACIVLGSQPQLARLSSRTCVKMDYDHQAYKDITSVNVYDKIKSSKRMIKEHNKNEQQ